MFDEDFLQRDVGAVDLVEVGLGAAVELGPDLVAAREVPQPLLHLRAVERGRVGDEDELEEGQAAKGANVHHRLERLTEVSRERRLAVAAQRHMPQLEPFVRQHAVPGALAQAAGVHKSKRSLQLGRHGVHVERLGGVAAVPRHFTVDALEIAGLLGGHVDPNRQAVGARGHHDIDELVVQEVARRAKRGLRSAAAARRELALPLHGICRQGHGLASRFFHKFLSTLEL